MTLRSYQRDRDAAERALDRWGAWRGFAGSLELRDAVANAIEAERHRIAKFLEDELLRESLHSAESGS